MIEHIVRAIIRTKLATTWPTKRIIRRAAVWCPHGAGDFCMLLPHLIEFCKAAVKCGVNLTVFTSEVGVQELVEKGVSNDVTVVMVGQEWKDNMDPLLLSEVYDLLVCSYYFTNIARLPLLFLRFHDFVGISTDGILEQNVFPETTWQTNKDDVRLMFCGLFVTALAALKNEPPDRSLSRLFERLDVLDGNYFSNGKGKRENVLVMYGRYFKRTSKYYPLENYHKFALIARKRLNARAIMLLGKADYYALTHDERNSMTRMQKDDIEFVISDDIRTAHKLLGKARWFVGPDGGGTHLAVLFGVPFICAMFGEGILPENILPPFHAQNALYRNHIVDIAPDELAQHFFEGRAGR